MTRPDHGATLKEDGLSVLAPESTPWHLHQTRRTGCRDCRIDTDERLGPQRERTLDAIRGLGLNDAEIAPYIETSLSWIKRRSDRFFGLREVAKLVRAKLFDGTI